MDEEMISDIEIEEDFIDSEDLEDEEAGEGISLATVASVTASGVTLIIDGEEEAGEKEYKVNAMQRIKVGDRVRIFKVSGTYLIEYVVGTPMSRYPIPAGGSDGQYLAKDRTSNYAVKWVTPPTVHGIPTGGTAGQLLAKNSGNDYDVKWVNQAHELPTGGTANQVLAKNSANNYDVKWVTLESAHGIPSGGTTGQVLKKTNNTNYAVEWGNVPSPTALTNGSYTVTCASNGYLYPSSGNISLGSNNGYWYNCYIKGSMRFGDSAYTPNAIGFFGKTPVSKQTLYTSSTLANVIALLQAYGLG